MQVLLLTLIMSTPWGHTGDVDPCGGPVVVEEAPAVATGTVSTSPPAPVRWAERKPYFTVPKRFEHYDTLPKTRAAPPPYRSDMDKALEAAGWGPKRQSVNTSGKPDHQAELCRSPNRCLATDFIKAVNAEPKRARSSTK